jgi:hypothetical protein
MYGQGAFGYEVDLTAQTASASPEPSTLATAGSAWAGALAWRHKRRTQS